MTSPLKPSITPWNTRCSWRRDLLLRQQPPGLLRLPWVPAAKDPAAGAVADQALGEHGTARPGRRPRARLRDPVGRLHQGDHPPRAPARQPVRNAMDRSYYRILVLGRADLEGATFDAPCIVISVTDPGSA